MTLVTDPPPPSGAGPHGLRHPVLRLTDCLGRGLDALADVAAWSLSPGEQREALVTLRAQRARLEELELRVLVSADRNQVGDESGAASTPAWLAWSTRSSRNVCISDLKLAQALDERFEATRQQLSRGDINTAQARVVVDAVTALVTEYDDLPAGTHARAEAHLLELAADFDAPTLRALGKRLFEVVCPEAADDAEGRKLEEEERRARRLAFVGFRDNGDGTVEGRFRLPVLHGQLLKKALESLTSPRVLGEGRFDPETGKRLAHSTLLGHGLMDLVENHLDLGSMPSSHGSPFTLTVTIGLDPLMSGLGAAAVETGCRISAGEARRLACKAGIIPMVLDGDSVPLDLGRERRIFSKHQKIAIDHRYHGCAALNCDRPPAWVEYHHEDPWRRGGRTDAKRGISLCPPHHRMADNPQSWNMHRLPDGGVRFSRRT